MKFSIKKVQSNGFTGVMDKIAIPPTDPVLPKTSLYIISIGNSLIEICHWFRYSVYCTPFGEHLFTIRSSILYMFLLDVSLLLKYRVIFLECVLQKSFKRKFCLFQDTFLKNHPVAQNAPYRISVLVAYFKQYGMPIW